jgi:uncharacterized protein YjbJ (UPF0337 family)
MFVATEDKAMHWDRIEGNWKLYRGIVKQRWSKLDDKRLDSTLGKRDRIAVLIEEEYGVSSGESDEQLAAWQDALD